MVAHAARRVVARPRHHQVEPARRHAVIDRRELAQENDADLALEHTAEHVGQAAILRDDTPMVGATGGALADAQHEFGLRSRRQRTGQDQPYCCDKPHRLV
jgi:hypothetical protein